MKLLSVLKYAMNKINRTLNVRVSIALFCIFTSYSVSAKTPVIDSDGDGLSDQYEEKIGTEAYLSDTDGDGVNDGVEIGENLKKPRNSDNDKRIDALDYDDDNDGLPTFLETKTDTDKDGLVDYLDTDSDNDGLTDGAEAGALNQDKNFDGIDDAFDSERAGATDNNGDGIDDTLKLPDHNQDGIADYLDATFKKEADKTEKIVLQKDKASAEKSVTIKKEKPAKKVVKQQPKKKRVINRYTDSDNDGLLDSQEEILGTNPLKRDSDGDKVSDAIEIGMDINSPQDSDHDNIIDALDEDDDNDGILTRDEDLNNDSTAINDDTDGDGVPNYLDANDDGDSRLTREEGAIKDSDNDNIPDYLDKNDGVVDDSPALVKKEKMPEEPEVVILFDGDASMLVEETEELVDSLETTTLSDVDDVLEKEILDLALNNSEEQKQSSTQTLDKETQTAKNSKAKSATSHWTLF